MILTLFVVLFLLFIISTPIFIALSFASLIAFALYTNMPLTAIAQRMLGGVDKFALMSIPFFILGANVMKSGGIARRILNFAYTLVGGIRGGLALTTELACMFFGAVSGSSPATVVAIGSLMYPALREKQYNDDFSIGLITSSGSVALLIPPSISAIVYGAVTGVSVGSLFMAGFGAGIIYGLAFLIYSYYYAVKNNVPAGERSSLKEIWKATKDASWALGIPIIIMGGIYFGIFTPTEASGIAAAYAIFIGLFVYKELTWKELFRVSVQSAASTAQVMILLAGASVLSWILTIGKVPQQLTNLIIANNLSAWQFLLAINIILLIAGMFIDGSSAIIILAPLVYSIAVKLGINPVHLGVIMVANAAIGMFTPPFGLNLFVASSTAKIPLNRVFKGVLPFIVVSIIALIIITYIPDISLLLPRIVYKGLV